MGNPLPCKPPPAPGKKWCAENLLAFSSQLSCLPKERGHLLPWKHWRNPIPLWVFQFRTSLPSRLHTSAWHVKSYFEVGVLDLPVNSMHKTFTCRTEKPYKEREEIFVQALPGLDELLQVQNPFLQQQKAPEHKTQVCSEKAQWIHSKLFQHFLTYHHLFLLHCLLILHPQPVCYGCCPQRMQLTNICLY